MSGLVILDLGYGNVRSVALAFERLGVAARLTADPAEADAAERLVLPGVGAAASAMAAIRAAGLAEVLVARRRPSLGICLGMQLLFEESAEDGGTAMLGLLPGRVAPLVPAANAPVPNMGWCALETVAPGHGLADGDHVTFAHGYACPDGAATIARARHGTTAFPAALRHGAWWGAQFHPERSSAPGARFLKAFLSS